MLGHTVKHTGSQQGVLTVPRKRGTTMKGKETIKYKDIYKDLDIYTYVQRSVLIGKLKILITAIAATSMTQDLPGTQVHAGFDVLGMEFPTAAV